MLRWKRTGRLLGIRQSSIDRDFKHPATAPLQRHLGGLVGLKDLIPRRTGAWLIASHTAIFDLDMHLLCLLAITEPHLRRRRPPPPNTRYHLGDLRLRGRNLIRAGQRL